MGHKINCAAFHAWEVMSHRITTKVTMHKDSPRLHQMAISLMQDFEDACQFFDKRVKARMCSKQLSVVSKKSRKNPVIMFCVFLNTERAFCVFKYAHGLPSTRISMYWATTVSIRKHVRCELVLFVFAQVSQNKWKFYKRSKHCITCVLLMCTHWYLKTPSSRNV